MDIAVAVDCNLVDFGRIVAVDCNLADFDRIVAADCSPVDFGRIAAVDRNSRRIEHKPVALPADSSGFLPVEEFAARVQVRLEPAERLGKCSSRAQLIDRKLDWHNGRRRPAVAWNFAACVP